MPEPRLNWTVASLLKWAIEDFTRKEFADARISAELLLAKAMETNRVGLYLKHDQPVSDEVRKRFREFVEKRRTGMPVAYVLGEKEFYSLPFFVNSDVLIPRPETEILVDEVIAWAKGQSTFSLKVLDVGTGSGAIALALKKEMPQSVVVACDVSRPALEVAMENSKRLNLEVLFCVSDLLSDVDGPFHAIVANLPYIAIEDRANLDSQVRDFEPSQALFGGSGGLEIIDRLLDSARSKLAGNLFLEIGVGQSAQVVRLLESRGYSKVKVRNDLAGIPRVVVASYEHYGAR